MALRSCLITLALVASAATATARDKLVAVGELVFVTCQGCHLVGDKKLEKYGPPLNDLFGRKPGSLPDYAYSLAMFRYGKDHVWDEATATRRAR